MFLDSEGGSMRTTLNLPENLLQEAMKLSNKKTKTDIIVYALENIIQREKIKELKSFRGKVDLNIDLCSLRNR